MPTLFKGPNYIINNKKRVDNLIEKERLYLRLIVLILFKGLSYILNNRKRVDDFIKRGRLY
jgi:hypothetical protein